MELRGNRDQLVIATKYTGWGDGEKKDVNACGNSGKSMMLGIKESLKRLRTDYVDIFYVHFWQVNLNLDPCLSPSTLRLLMPYILRPNQGLHHPYPGNHARPTPSSPLRQNPLPRYQRHARMDRRLGQLLC